MSLTGRLCRDILHHLHHHSTNDGVGSGGPKNHRHQCYLPTTSAFQAIIVINAGSNKAWYKEEGIPGLRKFCFVEQQ